MTVEWTVGATRQLMAAYELVAAKRPAAADRLLDRILAVVDHLAEQPRVGRSGRVPGTRELVLAPYVIAYRLAGDRVQVLAVLHGNRRWPDRF